MTRHVEENTPPPSPVPAENGIDNNLPGPFRQSTKGKHTERKRLLKKEIELMREQLKKPKKEMKAIARRYTE